MAPIIHDCIYVSLKKSITINVFTTKITFQCWFHHFMDGPEMEDLLNRAIKAILPEVIEELWREFLVKRGPEVENVSCIEKMTIINYYYFNF